MDTYLVTMIELSAFHNTQSNNLYAPAAVKCIVAWIFQWLHCFHDLKVRHNQRGRIYTADGRASRYPGNIVHSGINNLAGYILDIMLIRISN